MSIVDSFYKKKLDELSCVSSVLPDDCPQIGQCYRFNEILCSGYYWLYDSGKGYNMKIHNFYFKEDMILEMAVPDCLSVTWYDSIAGEQFSPYAQLRSCVVKSFIGGRVPFTAFLHKNIPIKSFSIEYEPEYYEKYLRLQDEGRCESPVEIFSRLGETDNFPEMKQLLFQIREYRGSAVSTELFFDAKATEALSLLYKRNEQLGKQKKAVLRKADVAALDNLAQYIDNHYLEDLHIDDLAKIACMGTTKLKSCFKTRFHTTVSAYITRVRMEKAEHLLAFTDLPVAVVAKAVGYVNAGYFDELFRKEKGILPTEFRKAIINNSAT